MMSRMFIAASIVSTAIMADDCIPSSCITDIRDPEVPLVKLAGDFLKDRDVEGTLEMVHGYLSKLPPSIETCLSNFNPTLVLGHLVTEIGPCVGEILPLMEIGELINLKNNLPSSLADAAEFIAFLKGTSDCAYGNVCTPLTAVVNNCLNKAIPVFFYHLENESSGCCEAFFENAKKKVGKEPAKFLIEMLQHVISVACSIQAPGFGNVEAQYCGYTFLQLFLGDNALNTATTMLPLLTMPNDQGCQAYNGEAYKSTLGTVGKLPGADKGMIYGACSATLDGLLSYIHDLPLFQHSPLAGLLAADQVLEGSDVLALIVSVIPDLVNNPMFETIKGVLTQLKFHMANHFSTECAFVDEVFPPTFNEYPIVIGPTPVPTVHYEPTVDPIQYGPANYVKDRVSTSDGNLISLSISATLFAAIAAML